MPGTVSHKIAENSEVTGLRVTNGRPLSTDEIEAVLDAYCVPATRTRKPAKAAAAVHQGST